jgi:hypothetical protein
LIYYLTLGGRWMFSEYLEYWGRELAGSAIQILRYEQLLSQKRYAPGTYVFSTRDEVAPAMGRFIDALAVELSAWPGATIYNDPRRTLRRFDLHRELWARGRSGFRSVRAAEDWSGLRFPLFVRSESAHDGALSPLLHSPGEVETWVGRALALGRSLPDLLVVEFCETADAGGWYRKYAAFCVGGRIVPRSMNYGRGWMLKFAGNDFSLAMAEEELEYVRGNPHEDELKEIFEIARTDYGRIDYSIKDGRVQPWEINLNPTIGRGLKPSSRTIEPELRATREETKEAFYERFNAAWAAVAAASPGAHDVAPLEIRIDESVVGLARAEVRRRWRTRKVIIQAGVDLVKPLMKTGARPLLQTLYRLPGTLVRGNAGALFRMMGRRARTKG